MKDAKRIVIKVGTSTLTYESGRLNLRLLERLVFTLSDIKNSGREILLVSSGAVGVGAGKLNIDYPKDTAEKQAAAAVGQCELMAIYDKMFLKYGHPVAQVLLNKEAVENEGSRQNIINTFNVLLNMKVIPIINENDTVSIEELVFGDNDTLSATVAKLTNSDALIILTDIDGLYDSDPRTNKEAKLITEVEKITDEIKMLARGKGTNRGTGGMITKLCAAELATNSGIDMAIINGLSPELLFDILEGKKVGTYFKKQKQG